MKYSRGAARILRAAGQNPEGIAQVAERVEAAVAHMSFGNWRAAHRKSAGATDGRASWDNSDRLAVTLSLQIGSVEVAAQCSRVDGCAVALDDYSFLDKLSKEAARRAESGTSGPVSVVDLGAEAVAAEIKQSANLNFDPHAVVQFIRSLAQDTYENQRLSYGLVLSSRSLGGITIAEAFTNKRFKTITDGFTTVLTVDCDGNISALEPVAIPIREGLARGKRPWWVAGVAEAAQSASGVGIALTRNGDLLVLERGRLAFSQRAGVWRKWNHASILSVLFGLWNFRGSAPQIREVLTHLYHLALDLSYRRHGGLIVVVGSEASLSKVLASRRDLIGSSRRGGAERALDDSVTARLVHRTDRRLLADLASMDGALVVDRSGGIRAYGAMTKSSRSAHQGARTRAAYGASQDALVIKVSSDGDITFLRNGRIHFAI